MKKLTTFFLIFCAVAALFTGCKKPEKPPVTKAPETPLFDYITDDHSSVFAANFYEDKPVCVSYTLTEDGNGVPSLVYDEETITAVFEALSKVTIAGESIVFIEDYERKLVFTMADGREYSFSFNIASIDVDGKPCLIRNDSSLWDIEFPLYSGATLIDLYAGGDMTLASSLHAATPSAVGFSYNGGDISVSTDPETVKKVASLLGETESTGVFEEKDFHISTADVTPFSVTLMLGDGTQHSFDFVGDCLLLTDNDKPLYYRCAEAVSGILALSFDGYNKLEPNLDDTGRKLVDDPLITADGGALLLLRSDYIASGASFISAWDVTVAGTESDMRLVYNYGGSKNYTFAEGFTARFGDTELDGSDALIKFLKSEAESLSSMTEKNGLTPAEYHFLWRATLNDDGELTSLEFAGFDNE